MTAPFGIFGLGRSHFAWSATAAVAALGALGTGVAFIAMGNLLVRVGAARGAVAVYFVPIVAVIAGVVFRDEHVAALSLAGMALVVVGAVLTSRGGSAPGHRPTGLRSTGSSQTRSARHPAATAAAIDEAEHACRVARRRAHRGTNGHTDRDEVPYRCGHRHNRPRQGAVGEPHRVGAPSTPVADELATRSVTSTASGRAVSARRSAAGCTCTRSAMNDGTSRRSSSAAPATPGARWCSGPMPLKRCVTSRAPASAAARASSYDAVL